MDILWSSARDLASAIAKRELSSAEITEALIERTEAVDATLGAYLERTSERALGEARAADERVAGGEALSTGTTVCRSATRTSSSPRGVTTTAGSRILEGFVPPYDATVVGRCCDARACRCSASSTWTSSRWARRPRTPVTKLTRNPWDLDCVPGGSSGGSAAIVAAGGAPWAWGTDTGGSVRQPASLCGLVGVKPTYGLVSRYGMIAFASSLDQAGPFTRTVKDAAALLELAAGDDPHGLDLDPGGGTRLPDGIDGGHRRDAHRDRQGVPGPTASSPVSRPVSRRHTRASRSWARRSRRSRCRPSSTGSPPTT